MEVKIQNGSIMVIMSWSDDITQPFIAYPAEFYDNSRPYNSIPMKHPHPDHHDDNLAIILVVRTFRKTTPVVGHIKYNINCEWWEWKFTWK